MDMKTVLIHELANKVSALKSVSELNIECIDRSLAELIDSIDLIAKYILDLETLNLHENMKEEKLKLGRVIEDVISELNIIANLKSVSFEVSGCEGLEVLSKEFILRRSLYNILHNAVKFSPKGEKIGIRCAAEEGKAVISVENSVDEESLKKSKGSGIGMTITRKLTEVINAEIRQNSNGSKVTTEIILKF